MGAGGASGGGSDDSWMGYLSKAVSVSASYLPTQVRQIELPRQIN